MSAKDDVYTWAKDKKIAVIHDWFFTRRGGERVLENILSLFPQADLYYLFGEPKKHLKLKTSISFFPSFLNKIPFMEKFYKWLLPLFPLAIESFDLSHYDLVISSSHCVAKGIVPPPLGHHITYIHSPMRYAWDQEHRYFPKSANLLRPVELLRRLLLSRLRVWDVTSAQRADLYLANSHFVKRRIELFYGKNAQVLFPPFDTQRFSFQSSAKNVKDKKILLFGAWVPYKGMLQALKILSKHNYQVIAAGQGEELEQAMKDSWNTVTFHLNPSEKEVELLYHKSHVLLFPAIEDFGIVPLEAMASGVLVVGPDQGGTRDTIIPGLTGYFFKEGNTESMLNALNLALSHELTQTDGQKIESHLQTFLPNTFQENFARHILQVVIQK